MLPHGEKRSLSRGFALVLGSLSAFAFHSLPTNALTTPKNNYDIATITPNIAGLVLFDPKLQVKTHLGTCPYIIRKHNHYARMYSALAIGKKKMPEAKKETKDYYLRE
jgi:hypothetical protein